MSEMECVHGTYKLVHKGDLTVEKFNEIKELYGFDATIDYEDDGKIEYVYTPQRDVIWLSHNKEFYVAISQDNIDPEDGYLRFEKTGEDIYKIETYFYNGGASLEDMFYQGLDDLKANKIESK